MGASISSEYGGSSGTTVRVRHAGGYLEEYDRPVSALELMLRHPRHWITSCEVFRSECAGSAIIAPESVLKPGQTYFIVPSQTLVCRMVKQGVPAPALHALLVRQGVNVKEFDSKVKRCDRRHGGGVSESKGTGCSYERKDTPKTPHFDSLHNAGVVYARKDITKTDLGQVQATQQLQGKIESLRGRGAFSDIESPRGPAKTQAAAAGSIAIGHIVSPSKAKQTVSLASAQATNHEESSSGEHVYNPLPLSATSEAIGTPVGKLWLEYKSYEGEERDASKVVPKSKDSQSSAVDYTSMEPISPNNKVCLKSKDNQRLAADYTSIEPISSQKDATGKNNEFLKAVTLFADMIFMEPETVRNSNAKDNIVDNQVQAINCCPKQQVLQPYQNDKQTEINGTLPRRKEQGEREQLAVMPIKNRDENKSSSLAELIIKSPLTKPSNEATKSATLSLSSFLSQSSATLSSSSSSSSPLPLATASPLSSGTTTISSVQSTILPVNSSPLGHHHLASGGNGSSTVCSQQPLDHSSSNETKIRIARATQKTLSDAEMQSLVLRTIRRFTGCRSRSRSSSWQPTLPPVYECASE